MLFYDSYDIRFLFITQKTIKNTLRMNFKELLRCRFKSKWMSNNLCHLYTRVSIIFEHLL